MLVFLPCRLAVNMDSCPRSDCKLLRSPGGVQLIVFFSAISETLKKEIYGGDKQCFCPMKTKGQSVSGCKSRRGNTNRMDSVCEWQATTRLHEIRLPPYNIDSRLQRPCGVAYENGRN